MYVRAYTYTDSSKPLSLLEILDFIGQVQTHLLIPFDLA